MPSSSQDMFDEENSVDGDLEFEGLDDVITKLKPFLKEPQSQELAKQLHSLLTKLNVKNLSDVALLEHSHLTEELFPVVNFLRLKKFLEQDKQAPKTNVPTTVTERYVLNLQSLMSPTFYNLLVQDESILTGQNRRKLVENLGDDIRENVSVVRSDMLLRIALEIVNKHPVSLGCIRKDSNEKKEAASSLAHSLKYRIDYLNSLNKRRTPRSSPSQSKRPSKAQNYGINPETDLPNELPPNETSESQRSKSELMQKMAKSGEAINWNCVKTMMEETYFSQRETINSQLSVEKILDMWPFIGKHSILQAHFEKLMETEVGTLLDDAGVLFPKLETFFRSEASVKRKGSAAALSDKLHSAIRAWESGNNSASTHLICIILCCMAYMSIPTDQIFLLFDETTSFDEVQASALLPDHGKPIIAVLGKDVQMNPKSYVVIEKRIISELQISVTKAILVMFMSYFVFKIEYETCTAPILDFLQRQLFKIESEGSRVGRKKTAKGYSHAPEKGPTRRYLNLMKKFREFATKWNMDLDE